MKCVGISSTMSDAKPAVLHSRASVLVGDKGQQRLETSRILLVGLRTAGHEVAKNLLAAGVGKLVFFDPSTHQATDKDSCPFVQDHATGLSRAQVAFQVFDRMYPGHVSALDSAAFSADYAAVIITEKVDETLIKYCREQAIPIFCLEVVGLVGRLSYDLVRHTYTPPVSPNTYPVVDFADNTLTISKKDAVLWRPGMLIQIFTRQHYSEPLALSAIAVQESTCVVTCDLSAVPKAILKANSFVRLVAMPITAECKPLADLDFADDDVGQLLTNLSIFNTKFGRLPRLHDSQDAEAFLTLSSLSVEEDRAKRFSKTCAGEIGIVKRFFGALCSQEVVKAITKRHRPMDLDRQFSSFDFLSELYIDGVTDAEPGLGLSILGRRNVEKLRDARLFCVGAGATGCEFAINAGLEGLCQQPKGLLYVTDDDRIALSNISRQVLYQQANVGQYKTQIAAGRLKQLFPSLNIETSKVRLSLAARYETWDDRFFSSLDSFVSCVDNFNARKLIELFSHAYDKPMFNCGTAGYSAQSNVFFPGRTASFSDTAQQPQIELACTEHTVLRSTEDCLLKSYFVFRSRRTVYEKLDDLQLFQKLFWDEPTALAVQTLVPFKYNASDPLHTQLLDALPKLKPLDEFEKDDPCHLTIVQTLAELYARLWNLPSPSELDVLRVVGRMQDAIITSSSLAAIMMTITIMRFLVNPASAPPALRNMDLGYGLSGRELSTRRKFQLHSVTISNKATIKELSSRLAKMLNCPEVMVGLSTRRAPILFEPSELRVWEELRLYYPSAPFDLLVVQADGEELIPLKLVWAPHNWKPTLYVCFVVVLAACAVNYYVNAKK